MLTIVSGKYQKQSCKIQNEDKDAAVITFLQHYFDVPASAVRQGKETKVHTQTGDGENKKPALLMDSIVYSTQKRQDSWQTLLKEMRNFSKVDVDEQKFNIQKSSVFLYNSNTVA